MNLTTPDNLSKFMESPKILESLTVFRLRQLYSDYPVLVASRNVVRMSKGELSWRTPVTFIAVEKLLQCKQHGCVAGKLRMMEEVCKTITAKMHNQLKQKSKRGTEKLQIHKCNRIKKNLNKNNFCLQKDLMGTGYNIICIKTIFVNACIVYG
jgi:hypothetical protein